MFHITAANRNNWRGFNKLNGTTTEIKKAHDTLSQSTVFSSTILAITSAPHTITISMASPTSQPQNPNSCLRPSGGGGGGGGDRPAGPVSLGWSEDAANVCAVPFRGRLSDIDLFKKH